MALSTRGLLLLASVLFFVSGALGLGYQLVWIKKAALIVGASQLALSTVVTSFFLGLALGSLFVGRYLRSRRWSPLFVYGLFEAAIGLFALAFPTLFELVHTSYGALYPVFQGSAPALFALRFALLFAFFLLPTFFMGGTLPLLLDGLVDRDQTIGSLTSFLYGLNILGAVVGVLVTGYFAVPVLGMNGTSLAAGVGNLSIAIVALVAFRRTRPIHPVVSGSEPVSRVSRFFTLLSFVSGFAALGYQMAWMRYFGLFNDATVYLTAILLAVYLSALATGSMALSVLLRTGIHPLRVMALAQPLVAILVFACLDWWILAQYMFVQQSPAGSFRALPLWSVLSETVDAIFLAPLIQVALVLFLPVTLLGIGLPAIIAAATRKSEALRASSGSLIFWNTLGSSAGGFAGGYLLIPLLGLTGTLLALAGLSLSLGVAAEWRLGREGDSRAEPRVGGPLRRPGFALAAVALFFCAFAGREDVTARTIRSYGQGNPQSRTQLVEIVEGPLTTAYVLRSATQTFIGAGNVLLAVAGHGGVSFQAIQGHLPALFYPKAGAPERALGIALGSGQSFGALLLHPVKHLDVVDISSEVVELSLEYFADYNHQLATDERVSFHLDDGRHFVERAPAVSYDVVSMEPPPPTAEGIYALYSHEFYQSVDRILRDGGVLMQWLPLYRTTPDDVRGMIKTQAAVFPHSFVVMASTGDLMVMSFKTADPPVWSLDWLAERGRIFRRERGVEGYRFPGARHPVHSRVGMLSLVLTGPEDIARLEAPVLHHDDDQRLSYSSGDRELLRRYEVTGKIERLSFTAVPLTPFRELQRYFAEPIPVAELDEERARALSRYELATPAQLAAAERRFELARTPSARASQALSVAELHDRSLDKDAALRWVTKALGHHDATPSQRAAVQRIARRGIGVFGSRVRTWIEALPPEDRASGLVEAMEEVLAEQARWEQKRRARYLLE